jgi:signal transduction histidine kinase
LSSERRARFQAEAANKKKDDYIAEISHELRTPINAIICGVMLLQSKKIDGEAMEQVIQIISRSAKAQLHFVEDLLDQKRIMSGKLRLVLKPTNLVAPLKDALELLYLTAEAKMVRLNLKLDVPELMIMGDPDRLQQIFCNLISNAIKFTPAGGEIEVRLECHLGRALITVKDTGEGIDPPALAHLFKGFFQAGNCAGGRKSGLGLGLWIAGRLVKLHKGSISADSEGKGTGAIFTISLPRWSAH